MRRDDESTLAWVAQVLVLAPLRQGLVAVAALVDARLGKGHVLLFAINPMWRAATLGSYPLVTNAILNFDAL